MEIVFGFRDYKKFLKEALPTVGPSRGARARFAKHLGCGTSFISQVIEGNVHLSLEQSVLAASFFHLTEQENHFFMLLVQLGRAGSVRLQEYYQKQIQKIVEDRQDVQKRLEIKESLSQSDQALYYSDWIFAAVHVLVSIPSFQTVGQVASHLGAPVDRIEKVLEQLLRMGLVRRSAGKLEVGQNRIHIHSQSPWVSQHHTHWRLRAIESFPRKEAHSLHFSSVMAISESDVERIREILLGSLKSVEKVVTESPEEKICCLGIDLFSVGGEAPFI